MAFWRRIWQRDGEERLAACTALDVGTEFAKALVFDIDGAGHGTVRGVGRKRQGLSHMQSGTVADIAAVVDNCAVALQEAEEMAGFRPTQVDERGDGGEDSDLHVAALEPDGVGQ
jgi:cell division ATPase FtsA